MVNRLAHGDFKAISDSVPKTVKECVEVGFPMVNMKMDDQLIELISDELVILASMLNLNPALNLHPHQLPVIAQTIYDNFKIESIEDIILCFRRGAAGFYGQVFRLDGAVITDWMTKYLDDKYSVVEAKHTASKEERKLEDVSYDAYKIRMDAARQIHEDGKTHEWKKKQAEVMKEMGYIQERSTYVPPNAEAVAMAEAKRLWAVEMHVLETGARKENWIDFPTWLSKQ